MKYIFFILFPLSILYSQILDDDMDGVENALDKCPNTPFFALVDRYGCTTKKLSVPSRASYSISIGYLNIDDDNFQQRSYVLDFSFYYKNLKGYIETSRYDIDSEQGQDDTTLAIFYRYKNTFDYSIGIGVYLPTDSYSKNKTDYFTKIKISHNYKDIDTFIYYKKTFMNDTDTYDTNTYGAGLGYSFHDNIYSSLEYYQNNSIYNKSVKLKYVTLYINYYLKNNFFISSSYLKGQNKQSIDKTFSLSLGYNF